MGRHTLHPVTVLIGINSFFSFLITVNPPFLGTTWTGLTQELCDIAYIKAAFNHFSTSFLTTSFITGFSLLWCSIEVFASSFNNNLCMQIEGLIPFRSSIDQAIASLYFLRICSSFCSSISVNVADMITGFPFYCSKKEYFKRLGNSFNINPSALVSCSASFCSLLHTCS